MKPNIVLLATVSCLLIGCHSETETVMPAEQAKTKAQIALIEQQKKIEKEKDRKHEICKTSHVKWMKNQIESASEQGKTGAFITTYYCAEPFTKVSGCYAGFSCENETNEFITTLKQNGYTVEEKEDSEVFDTAIATHYVSWSSK
jgi:lipoprotein